jgi:SAM-dependent methyltransferase
LKWEASKVVGVDISSTMIEQARAACSHIPPNSGTIGFQVADCSNPVPYEEGPFDLVFGAWLLNYAPSGRDMVEMFRNVALNLKDGGHFVAVTPPPTPNPIASVEAERKARPSGSGGLLYGITGPVEDGISFHAHADTRHGDMDFYCYHLRKEVYEASAREGGLCGELAWSVTTVPDEFFKDRQGATSVEELESYKVTPHYGILVITK